MVDVSRECCERYFGMDDELFDYTMATLRWLLALLLFVAVSLAIIEWACPWAASHIEILREMSNYTAVNTQ